MPHQSHLLAELLELIDAYSVALHLLHGDVLSTPFRKKHCCKSTCTQLPDLLHLRLVVLIDTLDDLGQEILGGDRCTIKLVYIDTLFK